MAKHCLICNKKLGALTKRLTIKDGCICLDCAGQYGVSDALSADIAFHDIEAIFMSTPLSDINEASCKLRLLMEMRESFEPSYNVGKYVFFDDEHRTLMITANPAFAKKKKYKGYTLLRYDDIIGFELLEDGESQSKGGLGSAVAGGVLFGPAGAVVGGVTGKHKSKKICQSLKLKLTLKDKTNPAFYLPLITSETETVSIVYKKAMDSAQNIISKLQAIDAEKQENENQSAANRPSNKDTEDPIEELKKYKTLVDEGILTEEEYAAKKKQILGI